MTPMLGLTRRTLRVLAASLILSLAAPAVIAQTPAQTPGPAMSQEDVQRIAREVQKKLASLTN